MHKGPKISVIVPIYNVEKYMSRCLESLRKQTLTDIEIICVNDGSTDGSGDVVRKQMQLDDRIQLVDKENGGVAVARNTGLDLATGDMIMFLDPDDYLSHNACERVYEERINHYADIIVFGSTPFPEIPTPDDWVIYKLTSHDVYYEEVNEDALFKEPCSEPFIWNRAFSRDFLNDNHLRFPDSIRFGEDIVFLFEAAPKAKSIQYIHDKLHYYQCYRSDSFMQQYYNAIDEKLTQHVINLEVITAYWYENGLLEKWGKAYYEWFLNFIVPDLLQFQPSNMRMLARRTIQIINDYELLKYAKKVRFEIREKYGKLIKIAKQG